MEVETKKRNGVRDRDRVWWLTLSLGLVFVALGVASLYFAVQALSSDDPYVSEERWLSVVFYAIFIPTCIGCGLWLVAMARRERKWHRARLAALRGDMDPMPLAAIHLDPVAVPDVAEKPLELMWRADTLMRFGWAPLLSLFVLGTMIIIGMQTYQTIVAPIFQPPPPYLLYHDGTPMHPMSASIIAVRFTIASLILAVGVSIIIFIFTVRALAHYFWRPFGIIATSAGIDAITEPGSRQPMDWAEMRLWEMRESQHFSLDARG
jgi:hypothetical protein